MKKITVRLLTAISNKSAEYAQHLTPEVERSKKEKSYAPLTPSGNLSEADAGQYYDALNWALEQKEIKNIALTGPFGAGKSSIIQSFQNKFTEYDFLNISLATFGNGERDHAVVDIDKVAAIDEVDQQQIEKSILQQIFYKKTQKATPDSKYKRRSVLSPWRQWTYAVMCALIVLSICRLMNIGFSYQPKIINWIIEWSGEWSVFFSYTVVLSAAGKVIYELIRLIRNLTFKNVKFAASSIEIEAEKSKSPLNENFEELLYFFEATEYHGLIIEDLDRFQSTDIFSKLRELNLLLNSSDQIKRKPVVFIYGIKDDLFIVGDRTKFFDFIIPVIPVVSSTNAGDKLYQMLIEAGAANNLSLAYVFMIGSYITDMRMVRNIFNEYIMYRDKMGVQAEEKLLGIIAYKNIYPRDFSDLHSGSGIIFRTFQQKSEAVSTITETLNEEIKNTEQLIQRLESEISRNIVELNTIYIAKIQEHLPQLSRIYVSGSNITPAEATQEVNFNAIRSFNSIHYSQHQWDTHRLDSKMNFAFIEKEVDPVYNYVDRYKIIKEKEGIDLFNLKADLVRMRTKKEQMFGLSVRELLSDCEPSIFDKELANHPLLVYLLGCGALDEQYQLYVSNFYEGVLKKNDQLYLIAVKNRQPKPFDFALTNCSEIVRRLHVDDFRSDAVLSKDLVNHLLQEGEKSQPHLKLIVNQLIAGTDTSWSFLDFYRKNELVKTGSFIKFVADTWSDFWIRTMGRLKDRNDDLIAIFTLLVNSCSLDTLKALNTEQMLAEYLRNNYFEISDVVDEKGKQNIQSFFYDLDLKVPNLFDTDRSPAFEFIAKNNLYDLTTGNIIAVLSKYSKQKFSRSHLSSFRFSDIMESGYPQLIDNFFTDINYSVGLILSNPHQLKEESVHVITLLNNADLSIDNKMGFIEKISFRLHDISAVAIPEDNDTKIMLSHIVGFDRLAASWQNVFCYFHKLGFDRQLAAYLCIGRVNETLSGQSYLAASESQTEYQSFAEYIYKSSEISEDAFFKLHPILPEVPVSLLANVPQKRLLRLITDGKIAYNQANLDMLNSIGDNIVSAFLKTNLARIGVSEDAITLLPSQIHYLLRLDNISDRKIVHLVNRLSAVEIMTNPSLSNTIAELIVDHSIFKELEKVIEPIFEGQIPEEKKVLFFIAMTKNMEYQKVLEYLPKLGENYENLFAGERDFAEATLDIQILKYLKINEFISDFKVEDERLQITNR